MSTALHQTALEARGLPVGQQLAMLFLLRDSLAKKVTPLLQRESGLSKPASSDWALLIQELYIKRGQHWFLTQCGRLEAERIAKAIARRHGIHHVTEADNISGFPLHASCTCGWTSEAQRTWNGQKRLDNAISQHLTMVEADEVRNSARDIRQEPAAPLEGLSAAMRAALLDMTNEHLSRYGAGYSKRDDYKPVRTMHAVVTLNRLAERGLVRLTRYPGEFPDRPQGEAHLTGDGAWTVRTLRRKE
jgi:hypothetical protein